MQILCVSCGAVDGKGKDSASAPQQPQRQAPATSSSGGLAEQAADWGEEEGDEEGDEEQDGEGDREGESAPPSSAAEKRSGQRAADAAGPRKTWTIRRMRMIWLIIRVSQKSRHLSHSVFWSDTCTK